MVLSSTRKVALRKLTQNAQKHACRSPCLLVDATLGCVAGDGEAKGTVKRTAARHRGSMDLAADFEPGVSVVIRYDSARSKCVDAVTKATINNFSWSLR